MKTKSILGYSGFFLTVFSLTACISFFSVPTVVNEVNNQNHQTSKPTIEIPDIETPSHGDLLIAQLASDPRIVGDVSINIEFPDQDNNLQTSNVVNLSGSLGFGMKSLDDISLGLDATIDYNGVKKDLGATLVDGALYLSLTEWNNPENPKPFSDLSGIKYKVTSADFETMIGMIVDVVGADSEIWDVNTYLNKIDLGSMTPETSSLDFSIECTKETADGYEYNLQLNTGDIELNAILGSDLDYNLTKLSIPELTFGDVKLSVDLNSALSTSKAEEIAPRGNPSEYLHFVNSVDIIKKVYKLVEDKRFGVDINATLTHRYSDEEEPEVMDLNAAISADLDKNCFDFDANIASNNHGKSLKAGYYNEDIYVNYNNVLKASVSTLTIGELLGRIENDMGESDTSSLADLTDFIADNEFMNEIQHGRYQGVLGMIDEVRCADNQISIAVSLSELGFGIDSKVVVNLDATDTSSSLASIEVQGARFSDFTLDATISLEGYEAKEIEMAEYPAIENLGGIYDQFYNIVQAKKAGLEFEGSILGLDEGWQGFTFSGMTQFDVDGEVGTGKILIQEHDPQFGIVDHDITLDVNGRSDMKFKYNDGLKGKFTIQTLKDIIDLVMEVVNDDDPRFSRYFSGMDEMAMDGIIGAVMNGQYFSLLEADVLQSVTFEDNNVMKVVVNPASLGIDMPIELDIARTSTGELDHLDINLVVSGVEINLSAKLVAYNDELIQQLPTDMEFMDFSEIKTLLEYVYNTAKLESFSISGDIGVGIGALDLLNVKLSANVLIDDNGDTSAYGTIKVPTIPAVNHTNVLSLGGSRTTTFYYTDGYVYLYRFTDITGSWWDVKESMRCSTSYFLDNIGDIMLDFVLGLNDNIKESIGDLGSTDYDSPIQYDKIISKFSFTPSSRILNLGLDLGVLLRNSTFKVIDINFVGTEDQYLSSLDLSTSISIIKISGDIKNNNIGQDNWTPIKSTYDSYILAHANDALNTVIKQ